MCGAGGAIDTGRIQHLLFSFKPRELYNIFPLDASTDL